MRSFWPILVCFAFLTGCMNSASQSDSGTRTAGSGGTISFCRPASIKRIAEAPNLYVNGEVVAVVKNNSRGTVPIDLNESYRFGLEPSALFMRVSDQTAFESVAATREDRYFIISGMANVEQGLAILAGGIIGAAVMDEQQDTGKANWAVDMVQRSDFYEKCSH